MSRVSDYEMDIRSRIEYMLFQGEPVEYIRQVVTNEFGPTATPYVDTVVLTLARRTLKEHGYEG